MGKVSKGTRFILSLYLLSRPIYSVHTNKTYCGVVGLVSVDISILFLNSKEDFQKMSDQSGTYYSLIT